MQFVQRKRHLMETARAVFGKGVSHVATTWDTPENLDKPAEERVTHPEGTFLGKVVSASTDKTKNDKLMYRLTFKTGQGNLQARLVYSPESPKAKWAFFKQLANLGVSTDFFKSDPDPEDVAVELAGKEGLIRVEHREHQGQTFADINWIDAKPDGHQV
jgi:hypothetical protein